MEEKRPAVLICPRCAAHVPDAAAVCPGCGERPPVAPWPDAADRIADAPAARLADDPADADPAQIPPRLAWRVRVLQARSLFSENAVKAGFMTGAALFVALGVLSIIVGIMGGPTSAGCGCMMIVEAPLIGIFSALAFGAAATVWQALAHTVKCLLDPKERRAARVLQQIEAGMMPGESEDEEPGHSPPDEGVTTPATAPDERVTQRSPGDVRREENPT
jgi:hypothetical protein